MDFNRRFEMAAAGVVVLVFLITVYLTQDFLSTILLSIVLVFLFKAPLFHLFQADRPPPDLIFFSILIVFITFLALFLGITSVLFVELTNLERSQALSGLDLSAIADITHEIGLYAKSTLPAWAYSYMEVKIREYLQGISDIPIAIADWIFPIVRSELTSFASSLPVLFAQLIVAVFFTYYLLIDGGSFVSGLDLLPRQDRRIAEIFLQELASIYDTLFSVYFTTSMLSGVLAFIGFSLLGVPYPFVLGALVGIFTLLPMLGPPTIFIPMALYYLIVGDVIRSLVIVIFGTVVLAKVIPENVIRPQLAMKSASIHPAVTLLAYTAPIFVVGIVGVIAGPALYGFLLAAYRAAVRYKEI